jgi:hypothetical protein
MLRWILDEQDGMKWTGLIYLTTGTIGVFLGTRRWTFGLLKILENSWLAKKLVTSHERLKFMEPVISIDHVIFILSLLIMCIVSMAA